MNNWDFLPPEHRPGGSRQWHDDWIIYYLGIKVPRTSNAFKTLVWPVMLEGNQDWWIEKGTLGKLRGLLMKTWMGDHDQFRMISQDEKNEGIRTGRFAPLPIPPRGEWQKSKVTFLKDGKEVTKEYYARTTKLGLHFSEGARWTNPDAGTPYDYVNTGRVAFSHEPKKGEPWWPTNAGS